METFKYQLLDFEIFKNLKLLYGKELFIWGASSKGIQIQKTLSRIGINVRAFCDSDVNKWGKNCVEMPIISPYKFINIYKKNQQIYIISCISHENELLKLLDELEINNVNLISYWGIKTAFYLNKIVLQTEEDLPIYDEVWNYQKKQQLKTYTYVLNFLKKLQPYNCNTVWIWQPGKVASMTLEERLHQVDIPTIHTHSLNYPSHVFGSSLQETWSTSLQKVFSQKLKIITGVREPLARDYSAFWQAFSFERLHLMPILNKNFQQLYENYTELILKGYDYTRMLLKETNEWVWNDEFEWFNNEIKKHCGIDIYQYPFDKEKGYCIIEHEKIQIFIFKTEKLDDLTPILNAFLGKNTQITYNVNQTYNKQYHLAYEEFKKNLKLPRKYVEHYYKDNPYMSHFYTEIEQKKYLTQWENLIAN